MGSAGPDCIHFLGSDLRPFYGQVNPALVARAEQVTGDKFPIVTNNAARRYRAGADNASR